MIVVAEGYARALRKDLRAQPDHELTKRSANTTSGRPEFQDLANAAEFLHWQLKQTGCLVSGNNKNGVSLWSCGDSGLKLPSIKSASEVKSGKQSINAMQYQTTHILTYGVSSPQVKR